MGQPLFIQLSKVRDLEDFCRSRAVFYIGSVSYKTIKMTPLYPMILEGKTGILSIFQVLLFFKQLD